MLFIRSQTTRSVFKCQFTASRLPGFVLRSPIPQAPFKAFGGPLQPAVRAMSTQEYKVKDLSKIELKNGQKQEVELEGIEGGKVLLVKVKDEVHAMSANCTHYGAPLKLGVLTGDGRLTCAWHGGTNNGQPNTICSGYILTHSSQLASTSAPATSRMRQLLIPSQSSRSSRSPTACTSKVRRPQSRLADGSLTSSASLKAKRAWSL